MKTFKVSFEVELADEASYPNWIADAVNDNLEDGESAFNLLIEEVEKE